MKECTKECLDKASKHVSNVNNSNVDKEALAESVKAKTHFCKTNQIVQK